jgi:uncharacterized protein
MSEREGQPRYTNRLIRETSPYLLQHAHNPVDWWPWGEAAFEEARRTGKPIFLSVGYATCHWCHVMERESFEDPATAELLNERFVPIKVDREERPDVDAIYMSAVQALTGQGGWPMSVWLNHDGEPFYGGTYFPPDDRFGRLGFPGVLRRIAELWETDRLALGQQAEQLTRVVKAELSMGGERGRALPCADVLHDAAKHFKQTFDPQWGGFGGAPKFPRSEVLRFLLRYHRRTKDGAVLEAVTRTLDAMHAGGIYDHLAGGFARYATDRRWRIPHFEKMLYDNALLVLAYLEGHLSTGENRYAAVALDVTSYVRREMTAPGGAFYSATDADSEGEEGRFFVWTPGEIDAVLGPERGRVVRAWYGVTEGGNFEGKNVLHTARSKASVAEELGMAVDALETILDESRPLLYEARRKRVAPALDDKIIASWNGLMISAFASAGRILDAPELVEAATRAARFVLEAMRGANGRLLRTWRDGKARHTGLLEDYAFLAAGCLDLFEATGEVRWLDEARALQDVADARFADPEGGWFSTPDDHEVLLTRPREIHDGATPSGTSIATLNALRLFALTGEAHHRHNAEAALKAAGSILAKAAPIAPTLLCALDWVLDRPWEVVMVQPEPAPPAGLVRALQTVFAPNAVRVPVTPGPAQAALAERVPLVRDRAPLDHRPTAYLCVEGSCRLPTDDPEAARRMLEEAAPLP